MHLFSLVPPLPKDCPAGFTKENMKFADNDKLKQLKLENYDLLDCTEECREDENCNFVFYTTDYNKKSKIGCIIYNEPDNAKRTIKIDSKKEIFCNKIQKTSRRAGRY